ncbi:MAG: hypothetical protein KDA78_09465 [Planctomycetaceae bacterium]|nr:hypothetical protein [Planctomycetaceae bacterium]
MSSAKRYGGIVHTYQKYDPINLPSPTQPPPDLVSPAFEHTLMYGNFHRLTPEELARAVHIDPSQIQGFGPSLASLKAMLEERKRKLLAHYETETVQNLASRALVAKSREQRPPKKFADRYRKAIQQEQIYELERLWYANENDHDPFAHHLLKMMQVMGDKYQVDELAANYIFTGQHPLSIPEAIELKEELEQIDELLRQLDEALENATIGVIDMEALEEFASSEQMQELQAIQQQIENLLREMAEQQGLSLDQSGHLQLTPEAYRIFQSKLLGRIFSELQASRSGRHQGPIAGEGSVELQQTKPYEFGDALSQMDLTQSITNLILHSPDREKLSFRADDLEIHRTRNSPKCATVVVMDVSGSTRYDGQYINIKRMALALDGLIRKEYPGDYLQFVEMASFAKPVPRGEIINLLPKPVTIHDPVVQLKVDMSRPDISEPMIPPHFTNIQHGLQQARRYLATQDTPNRQIIVITDGLPTAHFEENWLYLLYPPHERTEQATFREAMLCQREQITINIFLVPSWSQSHEDVQFAHRLAETTQGRVIFTAGNDLDRFVIWDYVSRKKEILG